MAARLNPKHDERARLKIQTSQLINRLNLFALGQPDPCSIHGKPIEMTDTQVRAALGLLRKTLPDLASTTIEGNPDNPVTYVIRGPTPVESTAEWLRLHAPTIDADETTIVADETK
jgi:hypothetical protein